MHYEINTRGVAPRILGGSPSARQSRRLTSGGAAVCKWVPLIMDRYIKERVGLIDADEAGCFLFFHHAIDWEY